MEMTLILFTVLAIIPIIGVKKLVDVSNKHKDDKYEMRMIARQMLFFDPDSPMSSNNLIHPKRIVLDNIIECYHNVLAITRIYSNTDDEKYQVFAKLNQDNVMEIEVIWISNGKSKYLKFYERSSLDIEYFEYTLEMIQFERKMK